MENVNDAAKIIAQVIERLKAIPDEGMADDDELHEGIEMLESALEKLVVKM